MKVDPSAANLPAAMIRKVIGLKAMVQNTVNRRRLRRHLAIEMEHEKEAEDEEIESSKDEYALIMNCHHDPPGLRDCDGNGNRCRVIGGDLESLIRFVLSELEGKEDQEDHNEVILLTIRSLLNPQTLFIQLERQYEEMGREISIGKALSDELKRRMEENQRRIALWIQLWTKKYFHDFREDPKLFKRLESFVQRITDRNELGSEILQDSLHTVRSELSKPEPPPPFVRRKIEMSEEENTRVNYEIFNHSPSQLALQLTLLEFNLVSRIKPNEFLKRSWKKNAAPNLEQWILWSEGTRDWISTVLLESPAESVLNLAEYFSNVALEMFRLRNFNGSHSILAGFRDPDGKLLGFSNMNPQLMDIESFFSSSESADKLREEMEKSPCIPLLQPFLREMALLDVSSMDYLGTGPIVNFQKSIQEWKLTEKFFRHIRGELFSTITIDSRLQDLICVVNVRNRSSLWTAQTQEKEIISEFTKDFHRDGDNAVDVDELEPHDRENELSLEQEDLEKLIAMSIQRTYPPGYQIIKQGEFNSKFFIILEGTVNLTKAYKRDGEYLITSMSTGQFFGNASTLTFGSATGTITVSNDGPAVIAEIPANRFSDLLNRDANLSIELCRCVVQSFIKKINAIPRPAATVKEDEEDGEEKLDPGVFPSILNLPPSETFCVAQFHCRINYIHKGQVFLSPNYFSFLNHFKSLHKKLVIPVEQISRIEMRRGSSVQLTLKDGREVKFQFLRSKDAGKDCFNIMSRIITSHKSRDPKESEDYEEKRVECVGFEMSLSDLDMKDDDWETVFAIGKRLKVPGEEMIHCERDGQRLLFVILKGSCRAMTEDNLLLDIMVQDETFAETEFFEGKSNGIKIQTAEETELLTIDIPSLEKLSVESPRIVALFFSHISQVLAARLQAREMRAWSRASYRQDFKISPVSILDPTAKYPLEKEGYLMQQMEKKRGSPLMEERYCKVKGGFMMIYNTSSDKKKEAMQTNREEDDSVEGVVRVLTLSGLKLVGIRHQSALSMQIITPSGSVTLSCTTTKELTSWMGTIFQWTSAHYRFNSFAPIRNKVECIPLVDGENAYKAMAEAMVNAKRSIFVNDWWLVPQMYVKRDGEGFNDEYRLDKILEKKAHEGVRVFVLVWNETDLASKLGSINVKGCLEKLHENIKVIRHPMIIPFEWSHHQKGVVVDQQIAFVGGLDFCYGRWDTQKHICVDEDEKWWRGSDYYNTTYGEPEEPDKPFDDYLDRKKTPRLPWHDVHMRIVGEAAKDVAYNFIQRWNHHKEAHPEYDSHPYLIPRQTLEQDPHYESHNDNGTCNVQIVRSICQWSSGNIHENSMQKAYLDLIENAEHYVYIENQFFVSGTSDRQVRNKIGQALVNRISRAIREQKPFHVFLVIPISPEGPFEESASVRYIMDLQWQTILRGENSIHKQLKKRFPGVDPESYISFYGLRSQGRIGGKLVTEQIYIHAKIMIADDCRVIISSANLNDRSLNGTRDSEIGAVVEDMEPVHSKMGENTFVKAKFATELRTNLWMEHLGVTEEQMNLIEDPISSQSISLWKNRAESNAQNYSKSFPWIPSNNIKTLAQLKQIREEHPEPIEGEHLNQIVGQVVTFPLHFLENEDSKLKPAFGLHKIRRFDKVFQ
eukprot:TRINITY_DN5431_c0_g2_i1.p1 TRINITY_DN5431_c0_g2~~TRINITY_DN5431_c0_g2_i1.p1  ORF type:complete len:1630 (-),score=636.68 TRINITY_DN5431_c0_g2_i1:93-4982(-)